MFDAIRRLLSRAPQPAPAKAVPEKKYPLYRAVMGLEVVAEENTFLGAWGKLAQAVWDRLNYHESALSWQYLETTCWIEEHRGPTFASVLLFNDARDKAIQDGWDRSQLK